MIRLAFTKIIEVIVLKNEIISIEQQEYNYEIIMFII